MENKKKVEFSKIILIIMILITVIITAFVCWIVLVTGDTTPLSYLIPAVFAELATATGFYYSKAKVENRIKLMQIYKVEPTEQAFSEHY